MSTQPIDPLAPETLGVEQAAAAPSATIVDMATGEIVEQKTDIAELKPEERALVVLKSTQTETDLLALIERTKPLTAVTDKATREMVHRGAMDHKNARLAIQHASDAATEDAKAFTKAVSKESKRLIQLNTEEEARLFKLRDDYDDAEKARKAEEERKEKERVDAIKTKIQGIEDIPRQSMNDTAEAIAATLDDMNAFEVTFEDFAEYQDEARAVLSTALTQLAELHTAKVAQEAATAAAAAAEAKVAEAKAAAEALVEEERKAAATREAALQEQIAALQAQLAAAAPKPAAAPVEEPHSLADAYRDAKRDPDGLSLDGWRLIGKNPDGDDVFEAGGMRAVWQGAYVVKEVAHMPEGARVAEFKTMDELEPEKGQLVHGGGAVSMAALDQPRQQALNAAAAGQLEALAGVDLAAGPDVHVEHVVYTDPETIDDMFAESTRPGAIVRVPAAPLSEVAATFADVSEDMEPIVERVSIETKEYDRLLSDSMFLQCLRNAGVDNWDGYANALEEFNSVD
ncbi:hypothetical protein [Paraburkholderia hospita]|uniref:hypothetical protein n=1 Tax=Paraburkholderia hospita TaxID=169430 RepID=UPI0008A76046|nr:hypothetical protein [Paraburkholderia hospita]SEH89360.1 hypothetical protein SAMN05192544_1011118 [Paraburkholderia hospita]